MSLPTSSVRYPSVRYPLAASMIIVRSCQILLVAVFVGGCSSDQDDAIQPPLTLNQLRGGIELEQRSSQTVTAQLDSTSRRRDIITEHLRLLVGDTSIPAIACYSSLANTRPLPGLLWMPGSPNIKEDLMYPLDLLPRWAEEGFFVLSIDRPFHGDRPGNREHEIRQRGWPPVFGDYVADLTLSLDYLASRSQVDPERLGMVGLSTGGLEALVVGALDPRLKAVVCVSGQLAWPQVFATDAWKHIFAGLPLADSLVAARTPGPQALVYFTEQMPGLGVLDAARVAPLLAPRPLLLLGGTNDPLVPVASARATAAAAAEAYARAGVPQRFAMELEPGRGHAFSKKMQAQVLAWCQRWL